MGRSALRFLQIIVDVMLNGKDSGLGTVFDVKFVYQARNVITYRPIGKLEELCHFFVRSPIGQVSQNM